LVWTIAPLRIAIYNVTQEGIERKALVLFGKMVSDGDQVCFLGGGFFKLLVGLQLAAGPNVRFVLLVCPHVSIE